MGADSLYRAVYSGDVAQVRECLNIDGVDVNVKENYNDRIPMILVVERGNKDVVELLLSDFRVKRDLEGWAGNTALSLAARAGHGPIVELLLATNRVDANHKDTTWNTTLTRCFLPI
jgi:ankyrin repeat protein